MALYVCVQPRQLGCQHGTARIAAERRAAAPLLLGARHCRSISPAHTALSSKPATRRRMMGQTDGRTDGHLTVAYYMLCVHAGRANYSGQSCETLHEAGHEDAVDDEELDAVFATHLVDHRDERT